MAASKQASEHLLLLRFIEPGREGGARDQAHTHTQNPPTQEPLTQKLPSGSLRAHRPEDLHRIRVEHMERQLANLTGLVQKALTQNVPGPGGSVLPPQTMNSNYLSVTGQYRGKTRA